MESLGAITKAILTALREKSTQPLNTCSSYVTHRFGQAGLRLAGPPPHPTPLLETVSFEGTSWVMLRLEGLSPHERGMPWGPETKQGLHLPAVIQTNSSQEAPETASPGLPLPGAAGRRKSYRSQWKQRTKERNQTLILYSICLREQEPQTRCPAGWNTRGHRDDSFKFLPLKQKNH